MNAEDEKIKHQHGNHHHLVEVTINEHKHETHKGENSVEHLKHLGRVPADEFLVELKHGKQELLESNGKVEIYGGEVFFSQKKKSRHEVEITINGKKFDTHRGENSVEHLRELGHVPSDEILSQFKDGVFVDLANNGKVEICGGEIFASHVKSGGSS